MRAAPRYRAVVFDLDGTLIDSLPLVLDAIAHALEPFGPPRPTMEIFKRLGGPPERFLPDLLTDEAHVPIALERMDAFHRANLHLIQPFTGVPEALQRLRAQGVRLGVWTGRDRLSTELLLRSHALAGLFGAVVCGDDLPSHKPDPAGLRQAVRLLGVTPRETLFIGDADVDVLGGAAASVDTLLIRHARDIDPAIAGKTWRVVHTPVQALDTVLGLLAPLSAD